MAVAIDFLGLGPIGLGSVPATDPAKGDAAEAAGRLVLDVIARGVRPSALVTRASLENAIVGVTGTGGSTNGVLHLLAIAREAGAELTLADFDRLSATTPVVTNLTPGGRYVAASPVLRVILLRAALFIFFASAIWALLPVIAESELHLGSGGYGLLLGSVGIGAVGVEDANFGTAIDWIVGLLASGGEVEERRKAANADDPNPPNPSCPHAVATVFQKLLVEPVRMSVEIASAILRPIIVSATMTPVPKPARTTATSVFANASGLRRTAAEHSATRVTSSASAAPKAAIGANCA